MWKKKLSKSQMKVATLPKPSEKKDPRRAEEVHNELAKVAIDAGNIQFAIKTLPMKLDRINQHMAALFDEAEAAVPFWEKKDAEAAAEEAAAASTPISEEKAPEGGLSC